MKYGLPENTKNLIKQYLQLEIGKLTFNCPYYQNMSRSKQKDVFRGKGNIEEIQQEIHNLIKRRNINLDLFNAESFKYYLALNDIGIDCSGLVSQLLNSYLLEKYQKSIKNVILFSSVSTTNYIKIKLKPFSNISADILTNPINCEIISPLNALPGDLIRFGKTHVALIYEIEKDKNKFIIRYIHSTWDFGKYQGVKTGEIKIIDKQKDLSRQLWSESPSFKYNWTYLDFVSHSFKDRGIRRLKYLN